MAQGLRKGYNGPAKTLLSYIFLKLKDKKNFIVAETLNTLKNILFYCINMEDIIDEIKSGFMDKNP